MAGNVNSQPRSLLRIATRFKALLISPPRTKADTGDLGQYAALVPVTIRGALGQTGHLLDIQDYLGNALASFDAGGGLALTGGLATSARALGGLGVAHALYDFAVDGGAQGAITPAQTVAIPATAILVGATLNSTAAFTSGGSATVSVGTTAGSSATAIKAATAVASLSLDALLNGVPTFAAPVKMTAAGSLNITVATADLTAGVLEIFVYYVVAAAA